MTPPPAAPPQPRRRRALSLRARLLAGLIALTAVFLVVMGVVSSVALGKLEQDQFNAELKLAARQSVAQIAKAPDGFAAAYLSPRTGAYGELTPSTQTSAELRDVLAALSGQSVQRRPAATCAPWPPATRRSTSR